MLKRLYELFIKCYNSYYAKPTIIIVRDTLEGEEDIGVPTGFAKMASEIYREKKNLEFKIDGNQ